MVVSMDLWRFYWLASLLAVNPITGYSGGWPSGGSGLILPPLEYLQKTREFLAENVIQGPPGTTMPIEMMERMRG
jgi:hypothetical protein